MRISGLNLRRWNNFKANKRGYWSLWIFTTLFILSLFAEFIANDKPIIAVYKGETYFPVIFSYPETTFGGDFSTEADYRDPFIKRMISEHGFSIWPLIEYSYKTINYNLSGPVPTSPDSVNFFGTDDQGRDVLSRLIYGFRLSVLFGLLLTIFSSVIGIFAGAIQGYFGGLTDLIFQRVIEVWQGLPILYMLIILANFVEPGFWWLLFIMLLFSWMSLVGVVRAEFLKGRNLDYVKAARALGVKQSAIIFRHILPNCMISSVTFMPFILSASITTLTSLDFLGLGLPPGAPSLGELLAQGKTNLQAVWLGITGFVTVALMLSLLVFVGEAVRDALDPRKSI